MFSTNTVSYLEIKRLIANVQIKMTSIFLPVTLVLCLVVLVCVSTEEKAPLDTGATKHHTDQPNPAVAMKQPPCQDGSTDKVNGQPCKHETTHSKTATRGSQQQKRKTAAVPEDDIKIHDDSAAGSKERADAEQNGKKAPLPVLATAQGRKTLKSGPLNTKTDVNSRSPEPTSDEAASTKHHTDIAHEDRSPDDQDTQQETSKGDSTDTKPTDNEIIVEEIKKSDHSKTREQPNLDESGEQSSTEVTGEQPNPHPNAGGSTCEDQLPFPEPVHAPSTVADGDPSTPDRDALSEDLKTAQMTTEEMLLRKQEVQPTGGESVIKKQEILPTNGDHPSNDEAVPEVKLFPPTGDKALPFESQQIPASGPLTPPSDGKSPPTEQQAPPTEQQAPPTEQQAPPTEQQALPTSEDAPSAGTSLEPPSVDAEKPIEISDDTELPGGSVPPPDTDSKPTDVIIQVPEATDNNLPSFDEWKQKMLAEQAEQEKSKVQEVQSMQTISSTPPTNKKGSKKVNYASVTCGAKVRATNTEAQHPGFILTENKDQYMINLCKAKKWFTVELCTPVQIQSLEIGNLELFSSIPESFVVQISEGYPAKEWKPLGTFHARDERTIQSFSVVSEQMYAHYIRIEMQSHYGTEHYCPLTVLRVFGLTVIEADEEAEEAENPEDTDDLPLQDTEDDSTLFSSATETVISLVKTVLSNGDTNSDDTATDAGKGDTATPGTTGSDTVTPDTLMEAARLQADAVNSSAKNVTSATTGGPSEPCAPDVITGQEDTDSDTSPPPTEPRTPQVLVDKAPNSGEVLHDMQPGEPEATIPDIVTLIERPAVQVMDYISGCLYCVNDKRPVCYSGRQSVCGYYRLWVFIRPTSCLDLSRGRIIVTENDSGDLMSDQSTNADSIRPTPTQVDMSTAQSETVSTATVQQVVPSGSTSLDKEAANSRVQTPVLSDVSQASAASSVVKTTVAVPVVEPSHDTTVSKPVQTATQLGPDLIQIRPSEPSAEPSKIDKPQAKPPPSQPVDTQTDKPEMEKPPTNGLRDIYAEDPTDHDEAEHVVTPPGDDIQYQKLTTGKKETTFMKLKNRIKDLELNLNLSSQYLEQLSQRYKKQMEEMYISLNRTITSLANTSRKAQEKDIKQQEHIADLQQQINQLNMSMSSLGHDMANVHQEVIERHLYLMLIEAVIFLMMLTWCLNRQERNMENRAYERPTTTPRKNSNEARQVVRAHKRRNSDGTPQRQSYTDCEIKKSGSENDIVQLMLPALDVQDIGLSQWGAGKKKKKKRQSNVQKSLSFGHLVGTSLTNNVSDSCNNTCSTAPSGGQSSIASSNNSYTSHAPKKRQSQGDSNKQMNGRVNGKANSEDRMMNGTNSGHRRNASDERCQYSDYLTKPKIFHRKSPSYDRNIYDSLLMNGDQGHNGYEDDLHLTCRRSTQWKQDHGAAEK